MSNFACLLALSLVAITPALSQNVNAIVSGSVTDSTGAFVPNVTVVAANTETGVKTETKSNESGVYYLPPLPIGVYDISAKAPGFRQFIARAVTLQVASQVKQDIVLELGTVAESIEVLSVAASPIETTNASVSNVVTSQRLLDLPIVGRDAGAVISLQAGVIGDNFNGMRTMSQNVTFDGVNIQEPRFSGGFGSNNLGITNSVDRVAEVRIVTAPADAEYGRGAAQVILTSRSGTNEIHGSLVLQNRVTALSANEWFNNQLGRDENGQEIAPRDALTRNQFAGRAGGPIIKNRTFWHFLYEGDRTVTKEAVTATVFTDAAKQGLFRFYPGARNGAAGSATAVVDFSGNPVPPTAATGDLQTISLFGRDPNRPSLDPTGNIAKLLALYPSPNVFTRGDGLNTAGYRWQRPETSYNDLFNIKIDHVITDDHRIAVNWHREHGRGVNGFQGQVVPAAQPDYAKNWTHYASVNLTSTLRPNLINQFRYGFNRFRAARQAPWEAGGIDILPSVQGQPFFFDLLSVTDVYNLNMAPQGRISPIYHLGNTTSWIKGEHAFRGGVEVRWASSNGFNAFYVTPGAVIGAGSAAAAVQNIATIPGIGLNTAAAQNLLLDLSGSLANWTQQFNSAGGLNPQFLAGENNQRTWKQRELSLFFKDDWKVGRSVTLNLGVRYEFYGVPFEANGKSAIPVNGSAGAFGISGSDFSAIFRPGAADGQLTQLQLVGNGTANPDTRIYANDWNNFAPAVGLSWSLPWLGGQRTVFRAGYGMAYDRNQLRNVDIVAGDVAGFNTRRVYNSAAPLSLSNLPLPVQPLGVPLSLVPLSDRTQTLRVFDSRLATPYNQTWNASLQHAISDNAAVTVRYLATKGSKLLRSTNVNEVNIFENGILEAFNITRAGGNAPLFDRIFNGYTVAGRGVVDGVNVRGSEFARANATFQAQLANGNVGAFANLLNTSNSTGANGQPRVGGYLDRAGLPENFIIANPQYLASYLLGNYGSSSYHSLQVEFEKRLSGGWTYQGNYTFSKALGEYEAADQSYEDSYRTLRNRRADKRLLAFHRTHSLKSNGTWELPFGRSRRFGRDMNRFWNALAGGWQLSGIFLLNSGRPFDVTAEVSTFNGVTTDNTPDVVGHFPKSTGSLAFDGNGPYYFPGLSSAADPRIAQLPASISGVSTLRVVTDAQGNVLLQSPQPGTLGSLGSRYLFGPSVFNVDLGLEKRFNVTERLSFELSTFWENATNTPSFANVTDNMTRNINSPNFGRITATTNTPRVIVLVGRINF